MENFFLTQWYDWRPLEPSPRLVLINKILAKLGVYSRLQYPADYSGRMTNIEQRVNLYHLVSQVLAYNVPGDLVELGCNEGMSSTVIQKIIDHFDPSRKFHVYDSFEGLPALHAKDDTRNYSAGDMKTNQDSLVANFRKLGLPLPIIHKGWFSDTLPTQLPPSICFAYLDGDLYDSILVSLQYTYPRLSKGAICLIDDYADPGVCPTAWNHLPGVKTACDEFLADKPEKVSFIYSNDKSHGFFRKM